MKHPRLLFLAAAASAWCVTHPLSALACDQHSKGTNATSASSASKAGGASCCSETATTAKTATAADHCAKGASATTASTASMDHCAKGASATTASTASMNHGAKGVSASAAGADHCAKGAAAKASASCPMHGMAMVADAGGCPSTGNAAADHDCAICFDELQCQEALRGISARAQVVTLRNGAMVVYTAETPGDVRKLQAAVARHHDRVMSALASSSGASLCGGCKEFRGAMASGKFVRELVNVKNGCQILLTSSDHEIVQRIHDMTGAQTAARIKS